jgi:hypothetical protein
VTDDTSVLDLMKEMQSMYLSSETVSDAESALFPHLAKAPYQYLLLRRIMSLHLERQCGVVVRRFESFGTKEFRQFCTNTKPFAVVMDLHYNLVDLALTRGSMCSIYDLFSLMCLFDRLRVADIHSLSWVASSVKFTGFFIQQEAALLKLAEDVNITAEQIWSLAVELFFNPERSAVRASLPPLSTAVKVPSSVVSDSDVLALVGDLLSKVKVSSKAGRALLQALATTMFMQTSCSLDLRLLQIPSITAEEQPNQAALVDCAKKFLEMVASQIAGEVLAIAASSTAATSARLQSFLVDLVDPRFFVAVALSMQALPSGSTLSDIFAFPEPKVKPLIWKKPLRWRQRQLSPR